eukprot:1752507-Pyramimonas_sp.AAC.1
MAPTVVSGTDHREVVVNCGATQQDMCRCGSAQQRAWRPASVAVRAQLLFLSISHLFCVHHMVDGSGSTGRVEVSAVCLACAYMSCPAR